jgi:hypothetical protein
MTDDELRSIVPGTRIDIRDVFGGWRTTKALSPVFLNSEFVGCYEPWLVFSVQPKGWDHPINWPAEDVRIHEVKRAVPRGPMRLVAVA